MTLWKKLDGPSAKKDHVIRNAIYLSIMNHTWLSKDSTTIS
ncbi:MAG: hypothetical protein ACPKPY_10420 [Nitrososphaeraceae archaeon]